MDNMDKQIISLLQKDGRQSSRDLANQLPASAATIRRRLRTLLQSGAIRIRATVDPNQVGYGIQAIIAFDVEHAELDAVIEKLAEHPEIEWTATTTGRFDIIAFALLRSTSELSAFMQGGITRLKGVKNTETFICLTVKKGHYFAAVEPLTEL